MTRLVRAGAARVDAIRRNKSFLQALVLAAGRGGSLVVQIVAIRTLTTLFMPDEVGRYYLLFALQTWAQLLLLAPPSMYLTRHFVEWRLARLHAASVTAFFGYTSLISLVSIPVFWLAIRFGFVSATSPLFTSALLVVWLVAQVAVSVISVIMNLIDHRGASVVVATGATTLALAGSVALTLLGTRTAESWIAGNAIGNLLCAIGGALFLSRGRETWDAIVRGSREIARGARSGVRAVWEFSWPIVVITGLYWIITQGYRRVLVETVGEAGVGTFAVAYAIGSTIGVSADAIIQLWILPPFYRRVAGETLENIDEVWQEYFAATFSLLIPLFAFLAAVSPFLLRLLAGPSFQSAPLVPAIAGVAEGFRMTMALMYLGGVARKNTREMIAPHVPGSLAGPLLIYFGSLYFGLIGAGVALAISFALNVLAFSVSVQKHIFSKLRWRDIWRPGIFAAGIVAVCIAGGLAGWRESELLSLVVLAAAGLVLAASSVLTLPRMIELTRE